MSSKVDFNKIGMIFVARSFAKLQILADDLENCMFVIRTGQCNCNFASACPLLSRIAVLRIEEPTLHEFQIDCLGSATVCSLLRKLLQRAPSELDADLAIEPVELFVSLGNKELIQLLLNLEFCSPALNVGNTIDRLRRNALLQIDRSAEVDFISVHFSQFC
jgi:hypothetical protein